MSVLTSLPDAIAPLRADRAATAVLLDIDGTLAPIVRHADDAQVPEPTRSELIAVAREYGFVACVSGRRAAVARRIVSLGQITYVGNHGTEVLRGGRTEVEVQPDVAEWSERMAAWAKAAASEELDRLRVRSEDKDVIRAFHWRGAPDEAAAEEAVRRLAAAAEEDGLLTHWGRKVLEVRPPVRMDKGSGVERLLAGVDVRRALYAGDDVTDVDAFRSLREMVADGRLDAATCVGVSSDETPEALTAAADVLVDGPRGVRGLLSALVAE